MDFQNRAVDVICQHTREGNMIPIKIRIRDEEGEFQTYVVKGYKDLSHKGAFTMPNGVTATRTIFPFDCKIIVFGRERIVHLYYNSSDHIWRISQ